MESEAEHFDASGNDCIIDETNCCVVVGLDGQRRLRSSHFDEGIPERNNAESLASAADAMTNFMIWEMVRTGLLSHGMVSSSARKMLAPAWLGNLDFPRKLASECAARIILLAQLVVPLAGYVVTSSSNWSIVVHVLMVAAACRAPNALSVIRSLLSKAQS